MKDYAAALEYLYGLEKFGMVFGLENVLWILDILGNPHMSLKTVHIAGTNGKGSVAAMTAGMLRQAGYSTGTYTSPHLVSFTERITVNGERIREDEVAALTEEIRQEAWKKDRERFYTFFDFTTALALEYFRRKGVDIAVIETGLGGRLDSTNVIRPLAGIITRVALDHTEHLGNTVEAIAGEKAGIIKNGVPVVTGAGGSALDVIRERVRDNKSTLYVLGRDFDYRKTGEQEMAYRGLTKTFSRMRVNLLGDHQLANAAIALCAIEVLSGKGFPVSDESVLDALSIVRCEGRIQEVWRRPQIIIDGAHNPDGILALREFLETYHRDRKKILVFGVMKDKEYDRMLEEILPSVDVTIFTRPGTERALPPSLLKRYTDDAIITEDTKSALRAAKALSGENDLILVTGSFYTIGEAKTAINEIF